MDRNRIDHKWQMPTHLTPEEFDLGHMIDAFGSNGVATMNPSENGFMEQNPSFPGFVETSDYFSPVTMNQNMGLSNSSGFPSTTTENNPFDYIAPSNFIDSVNFSGSQATDTSIFSTAMSFETKNHPPYSIPEPIDLNPMSLELSQIMSNGSHFGSNLQSTSQRVSRGSLTPSKSKRQQRKPTNSPGRSRSPIHTHKAKGSLATTPSHAIAGLEASLSSYSASSTFKRKSAKLLEHFKRLIEEEELYGDMGAERGDMCSLSASSSSSDNLTRSGCDFQTDNTSLSSTPCQPVSPLHNSGSTQSESSCRHREDQVKNFRCSYEACEQTFKHFSDWKRHEENHYPQERFMCLNCLVPDGSAGCAICKISFSMLETPEDHLRACLPLHDNPKHTFARKYHLNNHLRRQHDLDVANANEISGGWNYTLSRNWPRMCEFCGVRFTTWEERMKHLAKHFQKRDHFPSGPNSRPGDESDDDNDDDFDDRSGPPRKRVRGYATTKSSTNSSGSRKDNNNSLSYYYTEMGSSRYASHAAELPCRVNRQQLSSSAEPPLEITRMRLQIQQSSCISPTPLDLKTWMRTSILGKMTQNKWGMIQEWIAEKGSEKFLCLQDFNDTEKSKLAASYIREHDGVLSDSIFWFSSEIDPEVEKNLWDIARRSISYRAKDDPDALDFGYTWWEKHGGRIKPEMTLKKAQRMFRGAASKIDALHKCHEGEFFRQQAYTLRNVEADRKRSTENPFYLGAVKPKIAHGEAASGVTSLIKAVTMLQKDATSLRVGQSRRVFVNNFSAAGRNADALLEIGQTHDRKVENESLGSVDNSRPNIGSETSQTGRLAIVGMAGRFPDATSHEKLWELLETGLDANVEVPQERFQIKEPIGHTPFGSWIENPGLFDPRFFNMSPQEASQTDPIQRLALETVYEALEMSGYYGQTSDDWREMNATQDIGTYFITGGVRAFAPGRINYYFGFSGPSFNFDTACSSSACALLWCQNSDQNCWEKGGQSVFTRAANLDSPVHKISESAKPSCEYLRCSRHSESFTCKDHHRDQYKNFLNADLGICEGNKLPIDKKTHWRLTQHEGRAERRTSLKRWRCPKCLNRGPLHCSDHKEEWAKVHDDCRSDPLACCWTSHRNPNLQPECMHDESSSSKLRNHFTISGDTKLAHLTIDASCLKSQRADFTYFGSLSENSTSPSQQSVYSQATNGQQNILRYPQSSKYIRNDMCSPLHPETKEANGMLRHPTLDLKTEIFGQINKGFFMADKDWTCYRKNCFSLNCSYAASTPPTKDGALEIADFSLGRLHRLESVLLGRTNGSPTVSLSELTLSSECSIHTICSIHNSNDECVVNESLPEMKGIEDGCAFITNSTHGASPSITMKPYALVIFEAESISNSSRHQRTVHPSPPCLGVSIPITVDSEASGYQKIQGSAKQETCPSCGQGVVPYAVSEGLKIANCPDQEFNQDSNPFPSLGAATSNATSDTQSAREYTATPTQQKCWHHRQRQTSIQICDGHPYHFEIITREPEPEPEPKNVKVWCTRLPSVASLHHISPQYTSPTRIHHIHSSDNNLGVSPQEYIWFCDCCIRNEQQVELDDEFNSTYTLVAPLHAHLFFQHFSGSSLDNGT